MIHQLFVEERPRERCLSRGVHSLSLKECLALIIGSGPKGKGCLGLANELFLPLSTENATAELERCLFSKLEQATQDPYSGALNSIPPAARARLLAAFEIARRYSRHQTQTQFNKSKPLSTLTDLSRLALEKVPVDLRCENFEWLGFVPAYRGHKLGSLMVVARGQANRLSLHPKELFSRLLPLQAGGFFLVHNHPSNDTRPSLEDLKLTRAVRKLAQELDHPLLGHWIVGPTDQNWIDSRTLIMGQP